MAVEINEIALEDYGIAGVVTSFVFAAAFVLISTSPRHHIPSGSVVLVDRPQVDPVPWLLVSNSTARNQMVNVSYTVSPPVAVFWRSGYPFVKIASHRTELVRMPDPPSREAKLQIMVSEEIKGPEKWWRAAQVRIHNRNGNPLATNVSYYGHRTDFAPELLNGSTNLIARGLN